MAWFELLIGFVFGLMTGSTVMLWAVRHDIRATTGDDDGDTQAHP